MTAVTNSPPLRSWWILALLVVLPASYALFAAQLMRCQGPFWGAYHVDPTYNYLLNSLSLATLHPPYDIAHPGTPVQVLGGILLRLMHPLSGSDNLVLMVLSAPEAHAQGLSAALIGLATAAAFGAGWWVLRRTGRLDAALLAQTGPLLLPTALAGYSDVRPEPFQLALGFVWVAIWIVWAEGKLDLASRATFLVIAALGGIAVAAKYIFLPNLFLPLLVLRRWRERMAFGFWSLVFFIVAISPTLPNWRRLGSVPFRLLTREAAYGGGAVGITPLGGWLAAGKVVIQSNPQFIAWLVGALALLGWIYFRPQREREHPRHRLLLAGAAGSLLIAFAVVLKQAHGSQRYLMPAAATVPLVAFFVWRRAAEFLSPRACALFAATALALSVTLASFAARSHLEFTVASIESARATNAWIARELRGQTVIPAAGGSTQAFALASSLSGFESRWSVLLDRLYPENTWCGLWSGSFYSHFAAQKSLQPKNPFYLHCAPLDTGVFAEVRRALGWSFTPLWQTDFEAVYRVEIPPVAAIRP